MAAQPTPNPIDGFSDYLFWDVDRSAHEVERSKVYIIERVFSHGMRTDWELIKAIYGKETIKKVVMRARHLGRYESTTSRYPLTSFLLRLF